MRTLNNVKDIIKHYPKNHPLGYKIILAASFCGFIFIIISTAIQVAIEYQRELNTIDQQTQLIQNSYSESLAKSLWDLNQDQIELQIKGIKNLPYIEQVILHAKGAYTDLSTSNNKFKHKHFILKHNRGNESHILGSIEINFNAKEVYTRIIDRAILILLNQTLIVALIIFVIMVIFHRKIISHLETMANYSREIGEGKLEANLALNRSPSKYSDELDELATSLNEMRKAIKADVKRREEEQQELIHIQDKLKVMVDKRTKSLKAAKDAAENANANKSQFLSTISHEIRTPINGMMGMIQSLSDSSLNNKQLSQVTVLQQSTEALLDTFNNLLEYGRIAEGKTPQTKFSLKNLTKSIIALLEPEAERKNIALHYTYDNRLWEYYIAEEVSLRQVLNNLLANAIKFTEQGDVTLNVYCTDERKDDYTVKFEIIDTGIGIEKNSQQNLFKRFTQANESITSNYGGTGLGLAICKELVEHMKGEIGFHSTEGQGSTFWLEIPLKISSKIQLPDKEKKPTSEKAAINLLVVEDIEINQKVILDLLEDEGHTITIANNGLEALQITQKEHFDLILMDMRLPILNGMEVTQKIKNDPLNTNQNTKVIALTASALPEDIHSYLAIGIDSVISKPIIKEKLLTIINSHDTTNMMIQEEKTQKDRAILDDNIIQSHIQSLGREKLENLMSKFCEVYDELYPSLLENIHEKDFHECSHLSHKLAGACDTLGFFHSSALLRELEVLTENGSIGDNNQLRENLEDSLRHTIHIARNWSNIHQQ